MASNSKAKAHMDSNNERKTHKQLNETDVQKQVQRSCLKISFTLFLEYLLRKKITELPAAMLPQLKACVQAYVL